MYVHIFINNILSIIHIMMTRKERTQNINNFLSDKLESKRALAVKMMISGYAMELIMTLLNVSKSFECNLFYMTAKAPGKWDFVKECLS